MRDDGALAAFHDLAPAEESFRDAVLASLTRRAKSIACRFLYDERGSALFDEICELPEYYLTRTETAILAECATEIADLAGRHAQLIEFGSGAARKVRLLLDALIEPDAYVAIDISREPLRRAAEELAGEFPGVPVVAICADYLQPLRLPPLPARGEGRRLGFFPGSTIGNFTPDDAVEFLAGCRRVVGRDGAMLIGVDLKKDPISIVLSTMRSTTCLRAASKSTSRALPTRSSPSPVTPSALPRASASTPRIRANTPSANSNGWRSMRVSGRGSIGRTRMNFSACTCWKPGGDGGERRFFRGSCAQGAPVKRIRED
jgi:hypothetical protein